jgi:hypothetical protein
MKFFGTGGADSDLIKFMSICLLNTNLEQNLKFTQYGGDVVVHGM